MPDSFDSAAGWAAAGNAFSNLANTVSVQNANRRNRRFSREMYERTKQDNLSFYHMQNAYNSPAEQMKRFEAAGLNPNLIYGSSGDNSAANIPTPDVVPVNYRAPEITPRAGADMMSNLLAQADLRIKAAQANNLNEQTEVIRQDSILRAIQAERGGFDLDFVRDNAATQADFLREQVRGRRIQSDLSINRDAREAIQSSTSVSEAGERILNLIETRKGFIFDRNHTAADTERIAEHIRQMIKDGRLKDFEIKLNASNVSKNDPLYQRIIADFLSGQSSLLSPLSRIPKGTNFSPDGGRRQ